MTKLKELFKKTYVKILAVVIVLGLIAGGIIGLPFLINIKGKTSDYYFTPSAEFKLGDGIMTVEFKKEAGKDLKILNFTDVHFNDSWYNEKKKIALETIDALITEQKPDLITLSGDNAWPSTVTPGAFNSFVKFIDSYNIPWAPIMGNHEGDGSTDMNYVADRYMEAKNCLFLKGGRNIGGVGNYIINITENGRLVHALFMMDSGSTQYYPELKKKDYTFISPAQLMWYQWGVEGINAYNGDGKPVETTAVFHIPLPEFEDAYQAWEASGFDPEMGFGKRDEIVWDAPINSGFFDLMVKLDSTKTVLVGHDHINNYSILYKGIRLTYAMKTGKGSYWDEDRSGGTLLTLNGDGEMSVKHVYYKYIKS